MVDGLDECGESSVDFNACRIIHKRITTIIIDHIIIPPFDFILQDTL